MFDFCALACLQANDKACQDLLKKANDVQCRYPKAQSHFQVLPLRLTFLSKPLVPEMRVTRGRCSKSPLMKWEI